MEYAVNYLTGSFPYSAEYLNLGMALEGAMTVRRGINKERKLHMFHAFMISVVAAFGGGIFNRIWMGQVSGIISNDLCMGSCIIAFVLVNLIPFGFQVFEFLPVNVVIISCGQLFRSTAIPVFVNSAFLAFQDKPSAYYPIPVFGPIIYATLLGNMGAFLLKGFEKHIENGMPWPIQNGIFCASFYHFYVNDREGPIGQLLRQYVPLASMLNMTNELFAAVFVSLFMQITGILRMPEFLGPSFSPFSGYIISPFMDLSTWNVGKGETEYAKHQEAEKKRKKKKKKKSKSGPDTTVHASGEMVAETKKDV